MWDLGNAIPQAKTYVIVIHGEKIVQRNNFKLIVAWENKPEYTLDLWFDKHQLCFLLHRIVVSAIQLQLLKSCNCYDAVKGLTMLVYFIY